MLAGEHPYTELTAAQMMHQHLYKEIPRLPTTISGLSDEVNKVIQRATAKDPADRYPDMLSFAVDLRRTLTGSVGPTPTFADRESLFNRITGTQPLVYKGNAFWEQESVAKQILDLLADDHQALRFLAAVGPDSSSKSRAIRNGLIPALNSQAYFGHIDSIKAEVALQNNPLEALAQSLAKIGTSDEETISGLLRADNQGLVRAAQSILPGENSEMILFIDQFEEAFSPGEDPVDTAHFVTLVKTAVTRPRSRVRVFLTLRPEVYDHPLMNSIFSDLMQLGKLRLLTLQSGPPESEGSIEVTHEMVIQDWQQLRSWLDDSRYNNQLHKMLSAAARDWKNSSQSGSYLLRGTRLTQYEEWTLKPDIILSDEEQDFLIRCLNEREKTADRDSGTYLAEQGIRQRLQFIIGLAR